MVVALNARVCVYRCVFVCECIYVVLKDSPSRLDERIAAGQKKNVTYFPYIRNLLSPSAADDPNYHKLR